MVISRSSLPLTKVEKEYLDGTRQFTKAQQRYIRCRLRKKLRLLNEESCSVAAALIESSNAAATLNLRNYNKISAGSGNFVLSSCSDCPKQRSEDRISNPRVLSDMGLAIPRPTRLGDPRSSSGICEIIISFGNLSPSPPLLPSPKRHVGSTSNLLVP